MDNQQETFKYYIAGLFEGEGSLNIGKILVYGKQLSYRAQVCLTNTEPEISQKFVDYLKLKNYSFHVRPDIRLNRKTCYQINITKKEHKIAFLEEMTPLFVGKKRQESEVILNLLKFITNERKVREEDKDKKGRYIKGSNEYFDRCDDFYLQCKELKRPPTTTRDAPIFIG